MLAFVALIAAVAIAQPPPPQRPAPSENFYAEVGQNC